MTEVARVDFSDAKLKLDSIPLVKSLTLKRGPNFLALTATNNSAHDRLPADEQMGFSYLAFTPPYNTPRLRAFVISIPTANGSRHVSWTEKEIGPTNIAVAKYRFDIHGRRVLTNLDQEENPQKSIDLARVYIDCVHAEARRCLHADDEITTEMLNLMDYLRQEMTRVAQIAAITPVREEKEEAEFS